MKQLFSYIVLLLLCVFSSCSNDDNIWKYGEKQELAGTEWNNISMFIAGLPGQSFPMPTETLSLEDKTFLITFTRWSYDAEGQKVKGDETIKHGKYEYKHPKLKLVFEDSSEIEAWISASNNICFYEEKVFKEFVRQ